MSQENCRRRGRPRCDEALASADVLPRVLETFACLGHEAESIRELSSELGRGHSLLSDRFGSKEALWRAAVDHTVDDDVHPAVEAALGEGGDDFDRLVSAVRALHRAAAGSAQFARLITSPTTLYSQPPWHAVSTVQTVQEITT